MVTLVCIDHWLGRPGVWNRPGLLVSGITSLACIVAAGELVELWRKGGGPRLPVLPTLLATGWMSLCSCLPMLWPESTPAVSGMFGGAVIGLAGAMTGIAVWYLNLQGNLDGNQSRTDLVARSMLILLYLFPLITFLAPHRLLQGHNGSGLCSLLLILVAVKMSDAWAYGFGKSMGRTRLAPRLSPNKTVEGAIGGLLGAMFGALIVFWIIAPRVAGDGFGQSLLWMAGYALTVSVAGLAGDLFESMLKRDANCKDSSAWFPGLGGLLDVLDSLVFAAPASWIYWVLTGAA